MEVENITSNNGNKVAHQLIISDDTDNLSKAMYKGNRIQYFQSYGTVIAKRDRFRTGVKNRQIWLDRDKWDCSRTVDKYRNIFLGETKAETLKKIKSGEYILINLNLEVIK